MMHNSKQAAKEDIAAYFLKTVQQLVNQKLTYMQ